MKRLFLVPVMLWASLAWAADNEQVMRDLGPDKKLAVCSFRLIGADEEKNQAAFKAGLIGGLFGIVGAVVVETSVVPSINARPDSPYAQALVGDFLATIERVLGGAGAFQLSSFSGLIGKKDGKPVTFSEGARVNDLFACVTVESGLGSGFGFKKHLKVLTKWELIGPSGWSVVIKTDATSEDRAGVFNNTADPAFKPVFLQLAGVSTAQFLEKLQEKMKKAGNSAQVEIIDIDAVPVETLVNPGTFPQPEPECTLNSDGKWEKRIEIAPGIELPLVYIPNGALLMGSSPTVDDEGSHPQHQVTIGHAFWLGKYEVTQAQWKAVMDKNPSKFNGDDLPVDSVSWNESQKFLAALNHRLGLDKEKSFRLPTEAEWEYAARTGTTTNYSFSASGKHLADYAWFEENSRKTTHRVGQLRPNPWGAYDTYGNVSEWCEDADHSDYQGAPADGTAWLGKEENRIRRGGNWDGSPSDLRSYSRDSEDPKEGGREQGFRLVMPALYARTVLPTTAPVAAATSPEPAKTKVTPAGAAASTPVAPGIDETTVGTPTPAVPAVPTALAAQTRQGTDASITETDAKDSPGHAVFVIVNRATLPIIAVNLAAGDQKENRLSSSISVGGSATVTHITPVDYVCLGIVKSNEKKDRLCMGLKAGKAYTTTIQDADEDSATLTVINRSSLPLVAVKIGGAQSENLISSPIPSGGQATISKIPPKGLQVIMMVRSDGSGTLWGMTLNPGETSTYVMRETNRESIRRLSGLVALAEGETIDFRR